MLTPTSTPTPGGTPGLADLVGTFRLEPDKRDFSAGESVRIIVTVTNNGTAPASFFWVDFYINPTTPPTGANVPWSNVCLKNSAGECLSYGLAWYAAGTLGPGQSMTLTSDNGSYYPDHSFWPGYFDAGTTDLYLYVDSWNPGVAEAYVVESNEANNRAELHGLSVTSGGVRSLEDEGLGKKIPPRPVRP
jgi:hypothetical protein